MSLFCCLAYRPYKPYTTATHNRKEKTTDERTTSKSEITKKAKYPIPMVDEVFDWLGWQHACDYAALRKTKTLWATLPPGEDRELAKWNNTVPGTRMMLLRDFDRKVACIDPENDCNPFGGPDDY